MTSNITVELQKRMTELVTAVSYSIASVTLFAIMTYISADDYLMMCKSGSVFGPVLIFSGNLFVSVEMVIMMEALGYLCGSIKFVKVEVDNDDETLEIV